MTRLNALALLGVGIFAGRTGSYWLAQRGEQTTTPVAAGQSQPAEIDRKILYYRNPMGHPDTSPVPKKDSMGMDYIPVYAEEIDDPNTVKVSLDRIQRSGVKTEKVGNQSLARTVRAVGMVDHDETLLTVVTMRSAPPHGRARTLVWVNVAAPSALRQQPCADQQRAYGSRALP